MTQLDHENPWEDPVNSRAYAGFCASHDLYRASSRGLVELLAPAPDAHILDIGCGTGVSTLAVLERLGPGGRVTGIDASGSQIACARGAVVDDRATFVQVPPDDPSGAVGATFDGALSSAAFWQILLEPMLRFLARALHPGSKLVFNMFPDALPGVAAAAEPPFRKREDRASASASLERLMLRTARARYGYEHPGRPARDRERYESWFLDALDQAGFKRGRSRCRHLERTPEEARAWYAIPIFRRNVVPGLSIEESAAVLEEAWARWRPAGSGVTVWLELEFTLAADGGVVP
ncbi:MAG: methyltransferase domain-containing protein [Candidatus Eiseniibacteriota bacterium]|jgi:SAM-dependent methyltransferase